MDTTYNFTSQANQPIVYVRLVNVADLPDDVQAQVAGRDTIYAVHTAEGERLALVSDRTMAFALARRHDMEPVTVH